MDTSLEYRLMCIKAEEIQNKWIPDNGDWMISKGSYCSNEDECNNSKPCKECLKSSNIFVISGKYDFHESVGGTHWYFYGHSCVRGHGCRMNSTSSSVMTIEALVDEHKDYVTSSKKNFLWLPRQDQIQGMFLNDLNLGEKINTFNNWLKTAVYNQHTVSMEQLWMMFYMDNTYDELWNYKNKKWFT